MCAYCGFNCALFCCASNLFSFYLALNKQHDHGKKVVFPHPYLIHIAEVVQWMAYTLSSMSVQAQSPGEEEFFLTGCMLLFVVVEEDHNVSRQS